MSQYKAGQRLTGFQPAASYLERNVLGKDVDVAQTLFPVPLGDPYVESSQFVFKTLSTMTLDEKIRVDAFVTRLVEFQKKYL